MVQTLTQQFKQVAFKPGDLFMWSPQDNTVYYETDRLEDKQGQLALLHEVAHALLAHQTFVYDVELIRKEIEAWRKTRELAGTHGLDFDEEYCHTCLESYREWLYRRSRCPQCHEAGVQTDDKYHCFVCGQDWQVSDNRCGQLYRRKV